MKFHLSAISGNVFTACGPGFVRVNKQEVRENVVVTPDRIVSGWALSGLPGLSAEDFAPVATLGPEIVLLGTGRHQVFPHPEILRALTEAGVGVEVMDTAAACRTFNILCAEGRRVAAAVLIIEDQDPGG